MTRGRPAGAPRGAGDADAGTTLVELSLAMTIMLLLVALVPFGISAVSRATAYARGTSQGAAVAMSVAQRLRDDVASASQVCLPTQLTTTGPTVPSGFAVRVRTESLGKDRWTQWYVDTATGTFYEQDRPAGWTAGNPSPGWVAAARSVVNTSAQPPFSLPTVAAGSPQTVAVDVRVDVREGQRSEPVRLQTTIAAFNTPYALNAPVPCATAETQEGWT